jgi:nucleoid-associated protein YgaU
VSGRSRLAGALLLGLSLALGACAAGPPRPEAEGKPAAAPRVGEPPAPAPVVASPSPREQLAASHREKARQLEGEGHLRRAREEWKIALTIQPDDPTAQAGLRNAEARIEQHVAERIQQGRAALARGVHVEARRRFLAALALDPTNRVAFEALRNEVRDVEFITYTVRAGDTLRSIAQRYYGDASRFEVIWETNQLPPNPRLAAGTTLKIPEIPGVPFVHPEARREPPREAVARLPEATPPAPGRVEPRIEPKEEPPEVDPLLQEAREAFERKDYGEALSDLDKLLGSNPANREGLDLKKSVLYQHGKRQLDQKDLRASYQTLTMLVRLQPNYEDTAALLQRVRTQLVARHYGEGLRLYREEKLQQAIAEWRTVLEYDAQHANARRNIEQAERLLKSLEERKKKR